MRRDGVAATVGDPRDRGLEAGVLERLDLAAVVAHEVMVVVAAGVRGLEARDAVTEIDALHEPERVHTVERAVDARDPDASAPCTHGVVDLLGREAAVLLAEELDDQSSCAPAATARIAKPFERGTRSTSW